MQSFKLVIDDIDEFLRKSKQSRQEDIKQIKTLYK